ncbi:MAG: GTP-binding protein, partial [Verrucomicrobiia bacterium]
MTAPRNFILGTAGHVDHGKSALVKALTGTDPDRLPEEKERGITIDLGFANLALGDFNIGIVDVPGHEDFVRNAASGIAFMNAVLFVVAANEGWMPQSEEHLQILDYLDVRRGIFVVTKCDLPAVAFTPPRADWPVIRVSAHTGEGLEQLRQTIIATLAGVPPSDDIGKPRLHVDRVFTLKGIGTVVTGTLTGGSLKRGDKLVIQPGGVATRARSLHNHGREVDSLGPGARCAINLADVPVESVRRGDVVTQPELGGPCDTVDVALRISPRTKTKLKHNEIVNISLGSGHWRARVTLFDARELLPGEQALGQLRFEAPVYCFVGDRFIIREASTIAGGVVLDADARRGGLKESRVYSMMPSQPTAADLIRAWLSHDGVVPRAALLVKSRFSAATVEAALREAGAKVCAAFAADGALWKKTLARAAAAVDQLHRDKPEKPGFPLSELQALLGAGDEVFSEMLGDLCPGGQF